MHSYPVADMDGVSGCERVSGAGHTNLVSGIASTGTNVWSVGFDDRVRELDANGKGDASFST